MNWQFVVKGVSVMAAPDKKKLESPSEEMLSLIAGGTISDANADRLRSLLGQAKGNGWSKEEFFDVYGGLHCSSLHDKRSGHDGNASRDSPVLQGQLGRLPADLRIAAEA